MKEKIVVYPGTFDPITNGHIDVATRAAKIFDKVILAIPSKSINKTTLFSIEERVEMSKEVFKNNQRIEIDTFDGLLAYYAKKVDAVAIIRGLRAVSDFEYELQIALTNDHICGIETIFFMASEEHTFVTSSIVKEIAAFGGDISDKVPHLVWEKLKKKFNIENTVIEKKF